MSEKYLCTMEESRALCEFLEPMLAVDMRKRATAKEMKAHQWLQPSPSDEVVSDW